MDHSYEKQIADPIYGTIGLTDVEVDVINTRVFQRLSNINQLGAVHLVFPGAQYTRFAHSIGVCHVAGQILDSIAASPAFEELDDEEWKHEWQRYRLAALLHDVGHYPFSHAFENALKRADRGQRVDHEVVGTMVLKHNPELHDVLSSYGYDPTSISAIFNRDNLPGVSTRLQDVVSSGLDADRLDYLRRTAHYTGVPYGSIDGDYLVSQFQLDGGGNVCLTDRARLTADHFLLSRWFEYQQIIFHHTVQAADHTLEDVLIRLVEHNDEFECSKPALKQKIEDGSWASFDDNKAIEAIRNLQLQAEDRRNLNDNVDPDALESKCRAILDRELPKIVFQHSRFRDRQPPKHAKSNGKTKSNDDPSETEEQKNEDDKKRVDPLHAGALDDLAEHHDGIPRKQWYLWTKSASFTKIRPKAQRERPGDHVVRVGAPVREDQDEDDRPIACIIADDSQAVTSLLADKERYTWRLYVLFPHDWGDERVAEKREEIRADLLTNYVSDEEKAYIRGDTSTLGSQDA
jgi:HD superfamily phosphohydrolase